MRKVLYLVVALSLLILSGCTNDGTNSNIKNTSISLKWNVIQSPITGRYYEIAISYPGTNYQSIAISEITKDEFDKVVK